MGLFQLAALEKRIADLEKNMGKDLKLLVGHDSLKLDVFQR